MNLPALRDLNEQMDVLKDGEAIARLLNRLVGLHQDGGNFKRGKYAIFSAMHNCYASDGDSKWTIYGDKLVALLNWDSGHKFITCEVFFKRGEWIAKSRWRRSDVL